MNEPKTVIGVNTAVAGNITGDEDLVIEGRVEGTVSVSKTLLIESTGVVHAELQVRSAVIGGVLVGNVTAEESVQIGAEGRMKGDIRAPRVTLVDGAAFSGNIDMGEIDVAPKRPASAVSGAAPAEFAVERAQESLPPRSRPPDLPMHTKTLPAQARSVPPIVASKSSS